MQLTSTHKNDITTLCSDSSSLNASIAASAFHQSKHHKLEAILLVFEYMQLLSQILLCHIPSDNYYNSTEPLTSNIANFTKFFNPGYLLESQEQNDITDGIIVITLVFTLLKYLFFTTIVFISYQNRSPNPVLTSVWKLIFNCQGRVFYFFITSFWLTATLNSLQNSSGIFGIGRVGTSLLLLILLVLEYIFSIFLQISYHSLLPTKSFLSSKNSHTQRLTLTQKFIIQLLQVILSSYSFETYWIFGSVSMIFSLIRNHNFFKTLPLYRTRALFWQGYLLMIVTALDVTCFAQDIRRVQDYGASPGFIILIWVALSILLISSVHNYLHNLLGRIITNDTNLGPDLAIHKIILIKEFQKNLEFPSKFREKHRYSYLLGTAMSINLQDILGHKPISVGGDEENLTLGSQESLNKSFIFYLEKLQEKFPRNALIKLFIAKIFASKLKLYGTAIRLLSELQCSSSRVTRLNASLLVRKIQELMRSKSFKNDEHINLYTYLKAQVTFAELKKKMLNQADVQIDLYQEIETDHPNLAKIFNNGQVIQAYRQDIENRISLLNKILPDSFIEALLTVGHYQSIVNYSSVKSEKCFKIYSEKFRKYEKHFQQENLHCENLYQENTAFVIVSGQKDDLGKIYFCSKSLSNIFGGEAGSYQNINISSLLPIDFKVYASQYFENNPENQENIINQVFRGYSHHKEGYIMELDFCVDVFPFITRGLYFSVIMRPVVSTREYLLVKENGDIEGATQNLSKKIGLNSLYAQATSTQLPNVKHISEELSHINNTCNIIVPILNSLKKTDHKERQFAGLPSQDGLDFETFIGENNLSSEIRKAIGLYNKISTEGKNIEVQPSRITKKDTERALAFHCKLSIINHKSTFIQLITMQENKKINSSVQFQENGGKNENQPDFKETPKEITALQITPNEEQLSLGEENFGEILEGVNDIEIPKARQYSQVTSPFCTVEENKNFYKTDFQTAEDNLLSPISSGKFLLNVSTKTKYAHNFGESSQDFEGTNEKKLQKAVLPKTSERSVKSNKDYVGRAVNSVLEAKYYPKSIILFSLLFYSVLIIVLSIQIERRVSLHKTVDDLQGKKDLLESSQLRDSLLANVHRTSRLLWDSWTGALNLSDFGSTISLTNSQLNDEILSSLKQLLRLNHALLTDLEVLDEKSRDDMLEKNVRIIYPNSDKQDNIYFTNFQATDIIVETALRAVNSLNSNRTNSKDDFAFVFQNAVNDLLIKTDTTSNLLFQSIGQTIEHRKNTTNIYMSFRIVILMFAFAMFVWVTARKFVEEKNNLIALTRLNFVEINNRKDMLIIFKEAIEAENIYMISNNSKGNLVKKHDKKKYTQEPRDKEILKKYLIYIGEMFAMCSLMIFLIVWVSVSAINSNEFLREEQSKLYFADDMLLTINVAFLASQELFAGNDSTTIRNAFVSTEFKEIINNLNTLKNSVMKTLADENGGYDVVVENILFNDGCQYLDNSSLTFCSILESKALNSNLIFVLSYFEEAMKAKLEAFYTSNRTVEALLEEREKDFELILSLNKVLERECLLVAQTLNDNFEDKFVELTQERELITNLFFVGLFLLAFVSWILILRRLIQSQNKFKTVLKAFPSSLIVSNFVLKAFLVKTSNNTLSYKKLEA